MERILKPIGAWVIGIISGLGYGGIVLLMALESACIPLPSEVIMPFSGYLVSTGRFNFHVASIAGALGCAVGSAVAYWVGAVGGRPLAERYGRYVLLRRKDLDRADAWFARWGGRAVFVSRLLPIVRTFISLPAGIARMPFAPFITLSFLGSIPWCYLLTYIGMKLGEHWDRLKTYFHGADIAIALIILALFVLWLKHHLKPEEPTEAPGLSPTPEEAQR